MIGNIDFRRITNAEILSPPYELVEGNKYVFAEFVIDGQRGRLVKYANQRFYIIQRRDMFKWTYIKGTSNQERAQDWINRIRKRY